MSLINIFNKAEQEAKLIKLKSVSGNLPPDTLKALVKLKNHIIKKYNKISQNKNSLSQMLIKSISDAENSIYRYNTMKRNGLNRNVQNEKENIKKLADNIISYSKGLSEEPVLLEGAVSNAKYVWHSSEGSCTACQARDGREYVLKEDIPEKPHPNCKCTIEKINDDENQECDCHKLYDKIDEISDEVDTIIPALEDIKNIIAEWLVVCANMPAASLGYEILEDIYIGIEAYHDFQRIKAEMIAWRGYDKFYHAKANCEAVKRGLTGEAVAYLASIGKEIVDIIKKTSKKQLTFIEAVKDSLEDLDADFYGIENGYLEGSCTINVENVGAIINKFTEK